MPSDMAMHQPYAGIVRLERQRDVAVARQEDDIAARRVGEGEIERVGALVIGRVGLGEDGEVVAVQVDGVAGGDLALVVAQPCQVGRDDEVDEAAVIVVCFRTCQSSSTRC